MSTELIQLRVSHELIQLRRDAIDAIATVRRMLGYPHLSQTERTRLSLAASTLDDLAVGARLALERQIRERAS